MADTTEVAPDQLKEAKLVKEGEQYFYTHGDIKFPMNFDKLADAMEQMDKQVGPEVHRQLALQMGLPVEPFSDKHLKPVLVGGVQIVWHRAHGQTEDDLSIILKKQQGRVNRYLKDLEELKKKPPLTPKNSSKLKDALPGRTGGGTKGSGTRSAQGQAYQLNPAVEATWGKFDKQKGFIVRAFKTAGGTATAAQLVELIKALPEGQQMTASQPIERVVAFYLAEWKRNGLVLVAGEPGPPAQEAPKQEAPKQEAPKVDTSKLDTSKKKEGGKRKH